ncbi:MAG: imidazole glycerol phosphate synthase subunit HisH [Verrucomicrobiales bacterium]|jgi:imidazole glycerol phosphate synthase glutamine amidotransferase subunit|nr:imidazole glycerol phosphate synthase subunit HisH [Verrucomicrobiales bacterium]MDP4793615.1 imidazole glycerol phosphate synthase subunit HisH [Verrucomicrobiales bacterium]MDP4849029.1 imidazole glycerol phosphate synthase subunit HisH [Verrucomicrobiales bacterium]MDP4938477.1 imidazole glycerol phosphate synthase subunit HisH [Verrucomicrobiales bacterium]MDP5004649.1 imidazole glycerol phosphate synthase subunit HisH [Verrucomicrobiales bacterium]
MSNRVGVIDYGGGNLRNVLNVLKFLGHEGSLVSSPADLDAVDRLLFPGVGSFGDCVAELDRKNLRDPIVEWIAADRPYFGICLGYQVLFEKSRETPDVKGLSVFDGEVVHFPARPGMKVPHIGWNEVRPVDPAFYVWQDTPDPLYLYFVHSYFPQPADPGLIASTTSYGDDFASSISRGNTFAGQFHPERSQEAGLKLIANFLESPL